MITARKFIVTGRVQGVGFRYFACTVAARHGVGGTVRNLPDGTVEAVAEGPESAADGFAADLLRGPRSGRVDRVVEEPAEPSGRSAFNVLP